MQIEHIKLKYLKVAVNNSRIHSVQQVEQVAASIREFGFTNPILVDESNVIIAGHGRKMAAEKIGSSTVPCVVLRGLSEAQKRAYLIADNQIPLNAGWNLGLLKTEIEDLQALDFDTSVIGFDSSFLDDLLSDAIPPEVHVDAVPAVQDEPVTVEGDLWLMGDHRVMCGDSRRVDDVGVLCGNEKAQLLHADPPYGMGKQKDGVQNDNLYREKLDAFQMDWWVPCRMFLDDNAAAYIWGNAPDLWRLWYSGGLAASEDLSLRNEIVWDKKGALGMSSEELTQYAEGSERCLYFQIGEQFLGNINADQYWDGWDELLGYLKEQADASGLTGAKCRKITGTQMYPRWFSASQWSLIPAEQYSALQAALPGYFLKQHDQLLRRHAQLREEYRNYISGLHGGMRSYFDNTHDNMRDVWEFGRVTGAERHGHATPKPVEMMERVMRTSLPRGGLCIEPFGGSGSTLIGAERTGRRCYTMELTPKYVDVTVRRWQDLTGGQAVHATTGATFDSHATT